MCLTKAVVRILSEDDYLDISDRGKVESPEYLTAGRENLLSCRLFLMKKAHQRSEIRFFEFACQCIFPALFYLDLHGIS